MSTDKKNVIRKPGTQEKKIARSMICWCVIIRTERSDWINPFTIAPQRKQALQKYREQWLDPKTADEHLREKSARLAKVIVMEPIN
jgi:hypothetical protein